MYRIILFSFLLMMVACGEADTVPKGVLSKDEMRDVLLDMNIADAYSSDNSDAHKPLPDSIREKRDKMYFRQVLDLHHLTLSEFDSSYHFYESHPDRLKQVYDMMLDKATAYRENIDKADRSKQYYSNPASFLPYAKNAVISGQHDTIVPFVKKISRPRLMPSGI
jgi:hypothetical protein